MEFDLTTYGVDLGKPVDWSESFVYQGCDPTTNKPKAIKVYPIKPNPETSGGDLDVNDLRYYRAMIRRSNRILDRNNPHTIEVGVKKIQACVRVVPINTIGTNKSSDKLSNGYREFVGENRPITISDWVPGPNLSRVSDDYFIDPEGWKNPIPGLEGRSEFQSFEGRLLTQINLALQEDEMLRTVHISPYNTKVNPRTGGGVQVDITDLHNELRFTSRKLEHTLTYPSVLVGNWLNPPTYSSKKLP